MRVKDIQGERWFAGLFVNSGYSEIVDFGLMEKYRRLGVGFRLMDAAEKLVSLECDVYWSRTA